MNDRAVRLREEANKRLLKCSDEKFVLGSPDIAVEKAKKAYKLTEGVADLAPWHRLAAYRFAHLLMRRPDADLVRISGLFGEASGGEHETTLGASADIYNLAVLHRRLQTAVAERAREVLREEINATFVRANSRVQASSLKQNRDDRAQQDRLFNLLELASYFLDKEYEGLRGLGFVDPLTPQESQAWVLVGRDTMRSAIRLTKDFAMDALGAIENEHPEAILFRSDGLEESYLRRPAAPAGGWIRINDDWARFLAFILRNPKASRFALRRKLFFDNDDSLRQTMTRIAKSIRPSGGRGESRVFVETSDPVEFASDLTIYGAVHVRTLAQRPQRCALCHSIVTA